MFEDLEARLQAISKKQRVLVIREWRRLMQPSITQAAKAINPFLKGVSKPIFRAKPDRYNDKAISIWGTHPNVADDPAVYPRIPREGWHETDPYTAKFIGTEIYRTMRKGQEHFDNDSDFGSQEFITPEACDDYFTFNHRVYGQYDDYSGRAIPVYSKRALPDLVMEMPELEDIIIDCFEEAWGNIFERSVRNAA